MSDASNTVDDLAGLALAGTIIALSWPAARKCMNRSKATIGTKPPLAALQKWGRFLGYCGPEMLAMSISQFDPTRTSAGIPCCNSEAGFSPIEMLLRAEKALCTAISQVSLL
jgi:hypothetical protein